MLFAERSCAGGLLTQSLLQHRALKPSSSGGALGSAGMAKAVTPVMAALALALPKILLGKQEPDLQYPKQLRSR